LLIALISVALVIGGGGGAFWWYLRSLDHDIRRTQSFTPEQEAVRPHRDASDAVNVLVLGTDQEQGGSARADTIMLVHLAGNRHAAQVISIPRDTWLPLARTVEAGAPTTPAKINAAYAWGGAPLMVRTVESFTGVRIDHTVSIDFAGFAKIIDALGGIDIDVAAPFTSSLAPYRRFAAGVQHMNGEVALDYARQRKPFAQGDFARMRHQREILAAVFDKVSSRAILSHPFQLNAVIHSTARAFTVDDALSLPDMATILAQLRGSDLSMLTAPTTGTGRVGDQSVVYADRTADEELFAAVRSDTMDAWLAEHPDAG
jgi:LCP family protein required for cell wall assembly